MIALAGYPLGVRHRQFSIRRSSRARREVCSHIRGEFDDYQAALRTGQGLRRRDIRVRERRWKRRGGWPTVCRFTRRREHWKYPGTARREEFFASLGIPTPPFAADRSRSEFDRAVRDVGLPSVLKTRRFGYDGKGQAVIRTRDDIEAAWDKLGGRPLILEEFVPFERELSIIAVRGRDGTVATYPLIENVHRDGILHRSSLPPQIRARN